MSALLYSLFSPATSAIVFLACALWIWRSPRSTAARRAAIVAAAFYLAASVYIVSATLALPLTHGQTLFASRVGGRGAAIVLLGGGGERVGGADRALSRMSRAEALRVLEAARVFALVSPDWIISSGGPDPSEPLVQPSSIVMRDALVGLGVPPERIRLESTSRTTHDEAVLIAPMLRSLGAERAIVVTSPIHMPRALGAFRAVGVNALAAPAPDPEGFAAWRQRWLPTDGGLDYTADLAHEVVGLPYYWARGWWTR
jgi:uncharacterized SAM-binding protein YcdF (DUF218 family)